MSITTNEQRRIFDEKGYLVVPNVLSAAELERYGAAVDRGVAARSAHDTRPLAERTRYEQSFRQIINLWEDHEEVRPLTFHPRIAQIAAELVGVPSLRLWHDQALYKEPGGRETDPHHDQPYWPLVETEHDHGVDRVRRRGSRERLHGLRARLAPLRREDVREHLHRERLRPGEADRRRAASHPSSRP